MAEETITILRVGTEEAVRNIADLKNNIKALKDGFEDASGKWHDGLVDLTIGTKEYKEKLDELKVNQNALKDAMYATSSSMEDVAKAATGASESYNSLVHRMAAMKEEFRATNDEMRRSQLGAQIKEVNERLKEMDALQGNFQRNVGNYAESIKSAFGDMSKNVDAFRKSLHAVGGGLNGMKDGLEGISKSPFIATFGLLVSIAIKLVDELKENETAMEGIKKAMASLKPVMDFFSGVMEKLAEYLADIIQKVVAFVTNNGLITKVINALVGVGNAIMKFVIAPFKGIVAAIKTLQDEGIKGLRNAARAFGDEMKAGVAFKSNFEAGQVMAETIAAGYKKKKSVIVDAAKESAEEAAKEVELTLQKLMRDLERADQIAAQARARRKEQTDQLRADFEAENQEVENYVSNILEEIDRMDKEALDKAKQTAKDRLTLMQGVASSTSSILGSIADLYENDEKNSEKNARKVKNLRIAAATIDTISGAIGAFMQSSQTLPPPLGQIMGAAAAAAVTAAGIAEIAKIKSTKVSGSESASVPSTSLSTPPSLTTEVSNVRSIISASEEDRLNQMAYDQRVYILASDIEASQKAIKTQVSESSF